MAYQININCERYIDFDEKNTNLLNESKLKKLKNFAVQNNRFITKEKYKEQINIPTKWMEYTKATIDHEKKCNELNEWFKINLPEFSKENINSINKLNELTSLFYNDKVWGIHGHPGPLNYESIYILSELKTFSESEFVALDSEPGLVLETYLQLPYITLFSTKKNFDKLFNLLQYSYIGVVMYQSKSYLTKYYNFINDDYKEYTFGIDLNYVLCYHDFENYILTNKFFNDILYMIQSIK
jgi:hypothetical protein